ncbi:MAG: DEAD/DEAH box helicase [Methanobrevibacter sp.]|uniref:DUF3427 domain-containing protein n=1 Tax=Methanobrevibacter sp. TaxID=66852 RepID=UPI0026E057E9|nr:DEAD/DEAH box helicase [Methanobrevibacter sp.]MDO5849453.1 DEAD/DEAH box helicase [Methanobrevibacter sp.]
MSIEYNSNKNRIRRYVEGDYDYDSFRPSFLFNDSEKGSKVLSPIKENLSRCDEFCISVAFITESGITPLLQVLKELEAREVPGKILTTDYLAFSQPKALEKLDGLSNIEVRMFTVGKDNPGLHTKGYLFREDGDYRIIIGSSNLTQNALTVNKEWNLGFTTFEDDDLSQEIVEEFNNLWSRSVPLEDCIADYSDLYQKRRIILNETSRPSYRRETLEPNSMQKAFIGNLEDIYARGGRRALLISATGTGKTYAAAFALREKYPKRALFLVHREQIAIQALNTFRNVFGNERTMCLLSGNSKDCDGDFIFATIQTMSKEYVYREFDPEEFDYIVIDEVHRAGARSYQKIMDYFKPKFYLGMSASPDRMDGFDIYELFDHNIAYEIRLKQALEENLLCPFHYFGVTDIYVDDVEVKFQNLISSKRVNYIMEKCRYFGYSGSRVKGLMFCSNKKEACQLSAMLNEHGLKTICLTGENTQKEREDAIERLVSDERLDYLDYILTIDIFNEGVDIPEINQIVLLRETQSPIIFIQQLGRGLRKMDSKEYLVVVDFIGNYKNNFMIPIALSGDRTHNKDNLRKYVMEGTNVIPGNSTISFDRIAKEKIFKSIDDTNLSTIAIIREKYGNLKYKLGRIPSLVEFYHLGDIDPILIIENKSLGSYCRFLEKYEKDLKVNFSKRKMNTLEFVSRNLANGKRPHELLILKEIMDMGEIDVEILERVLEEDYHIINDLDSIRSAINVLKLEFNPKDKNKYDIELLDGMGISESFREDLEDEDFRMFMDDLIEYSLLKYLDKYINRYHDTNLVLYEKYSRSDVCRLLNWDRDESSTMYGYKIKHGTCPIFVTYEKGKDNIDYNDHFISQEMFNWMTRSPRTLESPELQPIVNYDENDLSIHLFVKKSDGEGFDFYYLGEAVPVEGTDTEMNGKPIVNFKLKLDNLVRYDIYSYFE